MFDIDRSLFKALTVGYEKISGYGMSIESIDRVFCTFGSISFEINGLTNKALQCELHASVLLWLNFLNLNI